MRALVIYESMFGNSRRVARAISEGLHSQFETVTVLTAAEAAHVITYDLDLLIIGAPTHAHSLPRPKSRMAAARYARQTSPLKLEPGYTGPGVREWFGEHGQIIPLCAVFDTRSPGPALLTGRGSKVIARLVRAHKGRLVVPPRSFVVPSHANASEAELQMARLWGESVANQPALRHRRGPVQPPVPSPPETHAASGP